jgi:hypothetical protein
MEQRSENEESLQKVTSKVENHQNQIYLLEIFGELLRSSSDNPEWTTFIEDLDNNNVSEDTNRKVVRSFMLQKGHKLISSLRSELGQLHVEYESLTRRISEWNRYRNQINIDLEHQTMTFNEYNVLHGDVIGVYSKELKMLCDRIEKSSSQFRRKPKGPIGACFSVQVRIQIDL